MHMGMRTGLEQEQKAELKVFNALPGEKNAVLLFGDRVRQDYLQVHEAEFERCAPDVKLDKMQVSQTGNSMWSIIYRPEKDELLVDVEEARQVRRYNGFMQSQYKHVVQQDQREDAVHQR